MPLIPDFPSPSDEEDDGRDADHGGIIDRIIDGNFPSATGPDPLPEATPSR